MQYTTGVVDILTCRPHVERFILNSLCHQLLLTRREIYPFLMTVSTYSSYGGWMAFSGTTLKVNLFGILRKNLTSTEIKAENLVAVPVESKYVRTSKANSFALTVHRFC